MPINIVAIGDLTIDLVMPIKFPIDTGASVELPWHTVEPAGSFNFLIAGQRIASPQAQYFAVGPVGDDVYGREVSYVMSQEAVNIEAMRSVPDSLTTVVLVLMEPDAGKFSYIWRGGRGPVQPLDATAQQIITQGDALFMQGYTLCEPQLPPYIEYAYSSGRPIWFDVGPAITAVAEPDRERIRRHAYAIMATEQELPNIAQGNSGQAAYDLILAAGVQLLVVKRGAEGCRLVTPTETIDVPAFAVQARDLVGAGDCFNAMFIYAKCAGYSLRDCAILANAAGAAKVQKLGTGRAMPTRAEVQAVLDQFSVKIAL